MTTSEAKIFRHSSATAARVRLGALAFAVAGILLALYPAIRPFSDEVSLQGAEVFGLHAIGQEALNQQSAALLNLANQIRYGPGFLMILVGLLLLAGGVSVVALAIWRSKHLPRWSGVPLALGFVLYIPQYVAPQPIRVAHRVLIAVGCL
jgi:hypothetical protein